MDVWKKGKRKKKLNVSEERGGGAGGIYCCGKILS